MDSVRNCIGEENGIFGVTLPTSSSITGEVPLYARVIMEVAGAFLGHADDEGYIEYYYAPCPGTPWSAGRWERSELSAEAYGEKISAPIDISHLSWTDLGSSGAIVILGSITIHDVALPAPYIAVRNVRVELVSGAHAIIAMSEAADAIAITPAKGHGVTIALTETADTLALTPTLQSVFVIDIALGETADAIVLTTGIGHSVSISLSEAADTLAVSLLFHELLVALTEAADTITFWTPPRYAYFITEPADTLATWFNWPWTAGALTVTKENGRLKVVAVLGTSIEETNITAKQAQVSCDAFATIAADTGVVASAEAAGDTVTWYIPWTRTDEETYTIRVGFRSAAFPDVTWWSPTTSTFTPAPPTITATAVQQGAVVVINASVLTAVHAPPVVHVHVGASEYGMILLSESGAGPWTYAYRATIDAGSGDVWWSIQSTTKDEEQKVTNAHVLHVIPSEEPSIALDGLRGRVSIEDAVFVDTPVPTCSSLSCMIDGNVPLDVTARVSAGGRIEQHRLTLAHESGYPRASVTFRSTFGEWIARPMAGNLPSMSAVDAINMVASPWQLAGDYASLLTKSWSSSSVEGETKASILEKIAIINSVNLWERDGLLYVTSISPVRTTFGVQRSEGYSRDHQMTNKLREWYTMQHYPMPITTLSDHDAVNWTPTPTAALIADVERPWSDGPKAPSGGWCLDIPTLGRRTFAFNKNDYDYFKCSWLPRTLGVEHEMTVRLYSDATQYWEAKRKFTGGTGSGWTITQPTGTEDPSNPIVKHVDIDSWEVMAVGLEFTQYVEVTCKLTFNDGSFQYIPGGGPYPAVNGLITLSAPDDLYNAGRVVTSMDIYVSRLSVLSGGELGATCSHMWITKRVTEQVLTDMGGSIVEWRRQYSGVQVFAWSTHNAEDIYNALEYGKPVFLWADDANPDGQSNVFTLVQGGQLAQPPSFNPDGWTVKTVQLYYGALYQGECEWGYQFGAGSIQLIVWTKLRHPSAHPSDGQPPQIVYNLAPFGYNHDVYIDTPSYIGIKQEMGATFNLWEDANIPMGEFVAVGTPTSQITHMTVTDSVGEFFLDAPHVGTFVAKRKYVDVEDLQSIGQWGEHYEERRSDNFGTEAQAFAYANGYLALHKNPRETYATEVPLNTPLGIFDAAVTPSMAILPVSGITYDYSAGVMRVTVGAPENTLNARLQRQAEKADRIEKRMV
jgi:hypothetical protein